MNKPLIFEGAGWDKASSASDIGNCRIRTRIKNNAGEIIYLEMSGRERILPREKGCPEFMGFVHYCHEGHDCNETKSRYRKLSLHTRINWQAKYLLEWVNENLNCSFDSLQVVNDGSVQVHETKEPLCFS